MPLFEIFGNPETLSRNSRAPPESIDSDLDKYNSLDIYYVSDWEGQFRSRGADDDGDG